MIIGWVLAPCKYKPDGIRAVICKIIIQYHFVIARGRSIIVVLRLHICNVAAGLSSALSFGDMTIVALFGSQQFQTLPWLLYQTMARYRAGEAAALALLLLCLTLLLFTMFVLAAKLAGRRNHA